MIRMGRLTAGVLAAGFAAAGCQTTGKSGPSSKTTSGPAANFSSTTASAAKSTMSATENPTAKAGRGQPTLDQPERPAAWIYVDGKAGKFGDRDGQPQIQWVIDEPVRPAPTFRVEAYGPLLGAPNEFKYLIKTVEAEGAEVQYAVSSGSGSFNVGKEYNLLKPGDDFIVRNWATGDVVREIAPLPAGKYLVGGTVRDAKSGKEAAAVTYFTVRKD
ncbi:MAG: hypothetical protein AABZ12_11000 [Planctomycetota bacterium]